MGVHQQIYETRLKYSDPDAFKAHNKAKVSNNPTVTNTSISGRGASGGLQNHGVKHYSINAPAPTPNPSKVAAPAPKIQAVPKTVLKPPKDIEYSPEILQAKERVAMYEEDALSGKTSNEIYNKNDSQDFLDKYKVNLTS